MLLLVAACSSEPEPLPSDPDAGTDAGQDAGTDGGVDGGPREPYALAVQLGGVGEDALLDVVVDGDAVYVAGYRNGAVTDLEIWGDSSGVVFAWDRLDGSRRWETIYPLEGATDSADALALDGETLIVAGRTTGAYGGFTNAGKSDLVISRLHREGGTATPVLQFGDERPQHAARVVLDGRGEVVIAGQNDLYAAMGHVIAFEDTLLARVAFDSAQNAFVKKSLVRSATSSADAFYGLAAYGTDGDVIVSGALYSTMAGGGAFVRRVRSDGTVAWSQTLAGPGGDAAAAVAVGPTGEVYVAGTTVETLGDRSYGGKDVFVIVLDGESGEMLRRMQAGTSEDDSARDLALGASGEVWVAGGTLGALPGFANAGAEDAFVVRFGPQGEWTTSWQKGSAADDRVNALALDDSGGAYVAGQTGGALIGAGSALGGRDGFVLRVATDAFVEVE